MTQKESKPRDSARVVKPFRESIICAALPVVGKVRMLDAEFHSKLRLLILPILGGREPINQSSLRRSMIFAHSSLSDWWLTHGVQLGNFRVL